MSKTKAKKFLLVGFLLVGFFNLTGCANNDSIVENSQSNTLTIPEDFPTNIPIHPGEVVVSTATGASSARTWVVEVLVSNLEKARARTISDLKQAGFQIQEESGLGTNEYRATLTNSEFIIRLKVYLESDTGQKEVMYVVTHM
jgi:hypothetical protein